MRVLVVYAHPDDGSSHNSMVLREVLGWLDYLEADYRVIDLYREGFDPVMPHEEWAEESFGGQVRKYQGMVKESDRLIFIYPIWWYTYPAILKGFFDRVFTSDFAYNFMKEPAWMKFSKKAFKWFLSLRPLYPLIYSFLPVRQHLRGRKALVINTYGGDEAGFMLYGRAPEYAADKAVLEFCGIRPVYRLDWYNTRHAAEMPPRFKDEIHKKIKKLLA